MSDPAQPQNELDLEHFYPYGYQGRNMFAIRAPFAMGADARDFIGRSARIAGAVYEILGVCRQISGPIAKGEPIGVEIAPATMAPDAA